MKRIKLGITIGDVNGIGIEVLLKTLADERILKHCIPIIYGSMKVLSYHKNIVKLEEMRFSSFLQGDTPRPGRIYVVNCWEEEVKIELGLKSADAGRFASLSLDRATEDLKADVIDCLVTAPINKEVMHMSGFGFPGHTEYLANRFEIKDPLMCMVCDNLRIALVTNHVAVGDIAQVLTKELIAKKVKIFLNSLKVDFGIDKPTLAVLGLNPHAGDGGAIGTEEEDLIRPVLLQYKKKGHLVYGPFAADGFFGSANYTKFDGILAMYHDQGLIPFKLSSFGAGVNFTAGIPIIRCSPDHGTAFDIAGKAVADESSFRKAVYLACDLTRSRKEYYESRANRLEDGPNS